MISITELLDLEDIGITISDISIQRTNKFIPLETPPSVHFYPSFGFKMNSRGIIKRKIYHHILQDSYIGSI